MQPDFVLGRIGRPHPRFDAIKRRIIGECPRDNARIGRRDGRGAELNRDIARASFFAEDNVLTAESGVEGVDQRWVIQTFLCLELRTGDETTGGILFQALRGGNANDVVAAGKFGAPRQLEIEMMPGTPGQRCGAQIFQGKFAGEADRFEAIGDGKLIVEGIDGARVVVRDELRDEAARLCDQRVL